ncbi:MAG: glycosyltransferase family 9 protein [Planctomycetes bacterium]|nr:glycosyltransferase family 9 protein [Planctomycetota bacterium]
MTTNIRMKSLQRADQALGIAACAVLQPVRFVRQREAEIPPRRVLAIKFWGLGSLQLLTQAIATLRRRHPFAQITLLTLASNAGFARGLGVFDDVRTLDVGAAGWLHMARRIARLVRELRAERFDAVYDFEFFTRFSSIVSLLTGAPRRHGFASQSVWRGGFNTDTVMFNRYWHVARNFRALAGGENGHNVTAEELRPHYFDEHEEARVAARLERHGIGEDDLFVVLNPNAGELSLERRWPAANFIELGKRWLARERWPVVLIGSLAERAYIETIRERIGDRRCINLAGEFSLGELVALFARAGVVVSNDSGPMHLAAAIGAPTLGLFGPETPVMYGPLGLRARALYRPPACSPCINVHDNKVASCIYGEPQCLMSISVDEVHESARALALGTDFEASCEPRNDHRRDGVDPRRG